MILNVDWVYDIVIFILLLRFMYVTENLEWIFYTAIGDGRHCEVKENNIWDFEWNTENEKVIVNFS